MRIVIQRVSSVNLTADGVPYDQMGAGILAMVGIQSGDGDEKVMRYLLDKLVQMRIFEDENGKMNLSIKDLGLGLFLVSNFTLYGDCRHGRRPSYSSGAPVDEASGIYETFLSYAKANAGVEVHSGLFQAEMEIDVHLSGPVTLLLDSDKVF
ncbi:MAG: D-tyrosyl-tRNA(Tyr) deacylase [Firmicutes bacterium]|nr:D-tyrosyl-tRNA(Tyr) deacylase [Bacillota bacterium]